MSEFNRLLSEDLRELVSARPWAALIVRLSAVVEGEAEDVEVEVEVGVDEVQ